MFHGTKVNSTKAGTHSCFAAENVLDIRDEDSNFNSFSPATSHRLKRLFLNTGSHGRVFP